MELDAFFDELEKIAFDTPGHTALAQPTVQSMGASGGMGDLVTKGSLATDKGIRHPWLPTNYAEHAFPSRTKGEIARHAMGTQQRGVRDVAKAIAKGGPLAGVRSTRGMMDIGQAQHGIMDIATHYERPLEQKLTSKTAPTLRGRAASYLRRQVPRVPGAGALGFAVSGMEHSTAGLKAGEGLQPGSNLDVYNPGATPSDTRAAGRAAGYGRSTRRNIIRELQKTYGMTPEAAEAAYSQHMRKAAPGRVSQAVGRVSRDVRHVGQQVTQPVRKAVQPVRKAVQPIKKAVQPVRDVGRSVVGKVKARVSIPRPPTPSPSSVMRLGKRLGRGLLLRR